MMMGVAHAFANLCMSPSWHAAPAWPRWFVHPESRAVYHAILGFGGGSEHD